MPAEKDVIPSGSHTTSAFNKMKSLREKSTLCDITLKINATEIPAHKILLAASSPYFEFMFTGNIAERTKECIEIKGFCSEAFLTMVNFIYSGYLVINEKTMLDVLKVADFLKVSSAKEKCLKYVQEHITLSNCIIIRDIAKKYYFTELEAGVIRFIEENFVKFINTDGFFQLSVDEVKGLVTEHSSYTDNSLYEKAICNWIEFEKGSREKLKEDLLGTFNVHIENLAQKNLNVYNSLSKERIYMISHQASSDDVDFLDLENLTWNCVSRRPKFDCIPPIFYDQSLYVICNDKCGILNMELDAWEITQIPSSNYTAGCSVPNGIYLITEEFSKLTFNYNPETNLLYPERQLIRERARPGVAFSENCLYVCGGGDESAERRDLRTNVWRSIADPPTSTDECSAASLDDRVFLTSISSGKFFEFDKRKGDWITKAEIPNTNKSIFALGATDNALYSYNGDDIFWYNAKSDEWTKVHGFGGHSSLVCVYPR